MLYLSSPPIAPTQPSFPPSSHFIPRAGNDDQADNGDPGPPHPFPNQPPAEQAGEPGETPEGPVRLRRPVGRHQHCG